MRVSVVIRTFNEGNWLSLALESLVKQVDIIIDSVYVVDSGSTDCTLEISSAYRKFLNIEIVHYRGDYLPGNSLNQGVLKALSSKSDFICVLSAHCIIQEVDALSLMTKAISRNIRVVFGRQRPLEFSDGIAWRDMAHLYPSESRVYSKHPVLNNAFSLYSKEAFKDHLFDKNITNLEDVIWAYQELSKGYKIQYYADVSVAHYHGPNHQNSPDRLTSTLDVIKTNTEVFKMLSSKLGISTYNLLNVIFLKDEQDLLCSIKVIDSIDTVISCPKYLVDTVGKIYPDYKVIVREFDTDKSLHFEHLQIRGKILDLFPRLTHIISYDSTYEENYNVISIKAILDSIEKSFPDIIFQVVKDNSMRLKNESGNFLPSDEKAVTYKVLRGNGTVYRLNNLGGSTLMNYESIELKKS